jgi:hypothetical protein
MNMGRQRPAAIAQMDFDKALVVDGSVTVLESRGPHQSSFKQWS